jgi:hypothetical protein
MATHCRRNVRQGTQNGFGIGIGRAFAVKSATAMADTLAFGAGLAWVNAQVCPKRCPFRSETVQLFGPARVRIAVPIGNGLFIAIVNRGWKANVWCMEGPNEDLPGAGGD